MKKGMQRMLAMLVAALLVLSVGGALAEKRTESSVFRFSGVQRRPEQPDPTQEPIADDEPLDPAKPETPAEPEKPAHNAVVEVKDKYGNLNIRAAAGEENEWIGALPTGAEITIISIEGNWALIRTDDGLEGYVSLTYLRRTDLPEEPAQEDKQTEKEEKPAEEPIRIIATYQVSAKGLPLNYRVEPDGEIAGYLEDGALVSVVELGSTWSRIAIGQEIYYVMTEYIIPYDPNQTEPDEPEMTLESLQAAVEKITISVHARDNIVVYGEAVQLTAAIPEELELVGAHLQWQQTDASGAWQDIPGANDAQTSVVITEANANSAWRVFVTVG